MFYIDHYMDIFGSFASEADAIAYARAHKFGAFQLVRDCELLACERARIIHVF